MALRAACSAAVAPVTDAVTVSAPVKGPGGGVFCSTRPAAALYHVWPAASTMRDTAALHVAQAP